MPKDAARLFLKVTNVSVEHLQSITPSDSLEEGVTLSLNDMFCGEDLQRETIHGDNAAALCEITASGRNGDLKPFINAWNSTIPRRDLDKYGWDANPWVWKIEFQRISREEAPFEDQM